MEELKGSIYITPKEIQHLTGKGYGAAHREHLQIRDALGKRNNNLAVEEYCEYNQVRYETVVRKLNKIR
jgi:hypothetical protein